MAVQHELHRRFALTHYGRIIIHTPAQVNRSKPYDNLTDIYDRMTPKGMRHDV